MDDKQTEIHNDDDQPIHEKIRTDLEEKHEKCNEHAYPPSYQSNSRREEVLLWLSSNFHQQYSHHFPTRPPVLLSAMNECGVRKFVSTTIRPTHLSYPELFYWEGCSQFVADHVTYSRLEYPLDLPSCIRSPETVLRLQKAHCFEMSTLLVSLLLGVGYDAYVVSGYAEKEICENNQQYNQFVDENDKSVVDVSSMEEFDSLPRYKLKPLREFESQYLKYLKEQEVIHEEAEKAKMKTVEKKETSPYDPYEKYRVHSWTLILPGKREIAETFFVEPSTGQKFVSETSPYFRIESIWNDKNYWVNKQECDIEEIAYDLNDTSKWEYLLANIRFPYNSNEDEPHSIFTLPPEEDEKDFFPRDYFTMPLSWVRKLEIAKSKYDLRYPNGEKVVDFNKVRVIYYSSNNNAQCLCRKVTAYADNSYMSPVTILETFANRLDKLLKRISSLHENFRIEFFENGRSDFLVKFESTIHSKPRNCNRNKMLYTPFLRQDGLKCRETTESTMLEMFEGREDCLLTRETTYELPKIRVTFAMEEEVKSIDKIVEVYNRRKIDNYPDESIRKIIYNRITNSITLLTCSKKENLSGNEIIFQKPKVDYMGENEGWNKDLVSVYNSDRDIPKYSPLMLFKLFSYLSDNELRIKDQIRRSELEIKNLIKIRQQENISSRRIISKFDTLRNGAVRIERLKDEEALSHSTGEKFIQKDLFKSYLHRLQYPLNLTRNQAEVLINESLNDNKRWILRSAEIMQEKLTKQKENNTDEGIFNDVQFITRVKRLNHLKEQAPLRQKALEEKLRSDLRIKLAT